MATPQWPLRKGQFWISQGYIPGHLANDLAANSGTPILSPDDGIVIAVNNNPSAYFGGNYIKIKGTSGYTFYMGHNSRNLFKLGDAVKQGQHIADVGMTGQATGPHIHFEMSNGGTMVNPSKVITKYPEEGDMAEKVNLDTARILASQSLARDGYDGRPDAHKGQSDDDLKKNHVGQELTNAYIRSNFFASKEANNAFGAKAAVYAERDKLRKQVADLQKQLAEAQKNNGSFTDEDRETIKETSAIVKWIKDLLSKIFK